MWMPEIVLDNQIHERIYKYIVYPLNTHFKLPTYHNIKYFNREIIELAVYSALQNQFIESSVTQLSTFIKDVPSADTIFHRLGRANWSYVLQTMKDINEMLYTRWKDKPNKAAYLAVDFHDIPRYIRKVRRYRGRMKKCDDIEHVVGTQAKRGTHYCHKIASIDMVEEQKFTLGFEPVFPDSDLDFLITNLILTANSKVSIKAVLMDREFFRGVLISKLIEHEIPYIIRAKKTPTIKRATRYMKQNILPYFVQEYVLNKNTHKKRRVRVSTTLVIVDNAVLEENDPSLYEDDDRYFAFVTNLEINTIDDAFKLARDFRKRWRIETGYRVKESFLAKTCSLSYTVRLFLILLSFILSNVWTLINRVFKDNLEFSRLFNNHIPTHMMKFIFWLVLITLWQTDKG